MSAAMLESAPDLVRRLAEYYWPLSLVLLDVIRGGRPREHLTRERVPAIN